MDEVRLYTEDFRPETGENNSYSIKKFLIL